VLDHRQHRLIIGGDGAQRVDELIEGVGVVDLDVARLPGPADLGHDCGEVRHEQHRGIVGGLRASDSRAATGRRQT